jgi:hypothetical protein
VKALRRSRGIAVLFLLPRPELRVGGWCHTMTDLLPGNRPGTHWLRRLGGPQHWSGWVWKILPPAGYDPHTVQTVARHYVDYAIPAHYFTFHTMRKGAQSLSWTAFIVEWNIYPFKPRIKSHLLFAGIIRSSPFSPR